MQSHKTLCVIVKQQTTNDNFVSKKNKLEMKQNNIATSTEIWISNSNGQYRIQNQEVTDDVKLTFWIPNEPIKVFNTTYENLIKIIESADKNLYDTIP